MTGFAGERDVRHELHLHGDDTCALTALTASSLLIETEVIRLEAHLLRQRETRIELTDGIEGTDVGHGVGAGASPYVVLVDILDLADGLEVARDAP